MERQNQLVFTVKDRCRVCYTCVRECPAKAIKIEGGQAQIIIERCIACGNCVQVCSQGAKNYVRYTNEVIELLASEEKTVALVAPSFPAEFDEISDYHSFIGMIKQMGFDKVVEVAFGAELVAKEFKKYLKENTEKAVISSDCPAVVYYVKQYYPQLVENLAPVVSPLQAMARVIRQKYGFDYKLVFIGPCIAKKYESDEIDYGITFVELRDIFNQLNITVENAPKAQFDSPLAAKGSIFPISRGLLQTMNKNEQFSSRDIIAVDGHKQFTEAISELAAGNLNTEYLELLCCEGCIMGPGMSNSHRRFSRRTLVKNYVKEKVKELDFLKFEKDLEYYYKSTDLKKQFKAEDRRISLPDEKVIQETLIRLGKKTKQDELNCRACGYQTCREHAIAVIDELAEEEMCLPYSIEKLHESINKLNISSKKLASAQEALIQQEKLASMGQLSAGIAHELNNPLGVITMYSHILMEEFEGDKATQSDLKMITEQAERCKNIVGGLLNFARKNQVKLRKANLKDLVNRSLSSFMFPDNVKLKLSNDIDIFCKLDGDQMLQALINLEKNAIEAMPGGGVLQISTGEENNGVYIKIKDTGTGIKKENLDKIFTPFFTTKGVGKGTGLGLPLVYGIIKMHRGKVDILTNTDGTEKPTGTCFKLSLPKA